MMIATWNVNSVRSRLSHLLQWLRDDAPDVVLLQELKCQNEQFPLMEIEELGYNVAIHGQKTYNGVAILSKFPMDDITRGLPNYDDEAARYIEAVITIRDEARGMRHEGNLTHPPSPTPHAKVIRVASVYIPNGSTPDDEKFQYKLRFLAAFHAHLHTLRSYDEMIAIGGDYNIAPTDEDVANPKAWAGTVLTHDEVRKRWRMICNAGWSDAHTLTDKVGVAAISQRTKFSWWDYRAGAFERNDGLRIDHFLLSPQAADALQSCDVITKLRTLEKPSDHAPVKIVLGT